MKNNIKSFFIFLFLITFLLLGTNLIFAETSTTSSNTENNSIAPPPPSPTSTSATSTLETPPPPPPSSDPAVVDRTPPTTPTELHYTNLGASSLTLMWHSSVDPEVSGQLKSGLLGYRIYKDNQTNTFVYSSINYIVISDLSPGVHNFRVVAFDANGNISNATPPFSVTLPTSALNINTTATTSSTPTSTVTTPTSTLPSTTTTGTAGGAVIQVNDPIKINIPTTLVTPRIDLPIVSTTTTTTNDGASTPDDSNQTEKNKEEMKIPSLTTTAKETYIATTTTIAIKKLQDITTSVDAIRISLEENKKKILEVVDKHIAKIISENNLIETSDEVQTLKLIRSNLVNEIDSTFADAKTSGYNPTQALEPKIRDVLNRIDNIKTPVANVPVTNPRVEEINNILVQFSTTVENQSKNLKEQGGDLLYKDTNKDGISDYESVYLYNIDPIKPSPVTEYNGKQITAGERVLLGFDPADPDLVKIKPEDASGSLLTETPVYKVSDVKLNEEKKVVLKGEALPNSLVTVYIYSTPIIVVVKTNDSGEWQYTLDKELETGEHRVYTASVNNSGKIVAKSSLFTFTKTAEAATLNPSTLGDVSSQNNQPGLLSNGNLYLILVIFIAIVGLSIGVIGINNKSTAQITTEDLNKIGDSQNKS